MLNELIEKGQFPYGRRKYQYQSIEEEGMPGIRNMEHRYSILEFPSFRDKTMLDIGCSLGMICIKASKDGARKCVGIDNNIDTIEVAKKYIYMKDYKNIDLFSYDINEGMEGLISLIGSKPFDYVLALSILKHVKKQVLFDIINFYTKEVCWFEGHNNQNPNKIENLLRDNLNFKSIKFLGHTNDRGSRPNFKMIKNEAICQ